MLTTDLDTIRPQFELPQRATAGTPLRRGPELLRALCALVAAAPLILQAADEGELNIDKTVQIGNTKPIWVAVSGFTGEALQTLEFDLYVQGFNFTNTEGAQYLISGNNSATLQARVTDKINKSTLVSKAYTGSSTRRQVHAFVDDFTVALQRKPICQTRIAFKNDTGPTSEIYISDFDGRNEQAVTHDGSIVSAPSWVPNRMALYYNSYKLNHADIFFQDLPSGSRKAFARYGGSNMSPAVSPDGTKVAMILSKDGWTDLYVCGTDGSGLLRLTKSREDESAPCWSPDSRWICFAAKLKERRALCKISASGGEIQRIPTIGVVNPTEPDWSPDGKWIVFTSMMGGFEICVVPSQGGNVTQLVSGEDPSWAPNSRTVIFARRAGGRRSLSLLDVMTKQSKDITRLSGSNSQPSWAR